MKIFNHYYYLIRTEKPIPDKRIAAIKQGKAWLRSRKAKGEGEKIGSGPLQEAENSKNETNLRL